MATKLNVYDLNRKKTAILQNAYNIVETQTLNKIYTLTFSLPATDEKAGFCLPFHYVRWGEKGELYRIIKSGISESDITTLNVNCEHVIATLCDDIMFGVEQYGGAGVSTEEVINYLFSKQKTQNWRLKNCGFAMNYEYLWEQENILNALYSIPKEFATPYKWSFDTTVYPWLISLEPIDETVKPQYYIRGKRNLLGSSTQQNFADICTRIYPLGYGEGVNQLGIKEVNNGVPYLQAPDAVVAQYGIKEKVLVERQFESAESLKAYAQTMLDNLQTPSMSRTFDVVDLYEITSADIDNAKVGNICKMTADDTISYITKTVRRLDKAGDLKIELSSKSTNIAETIASLADRVRIESVYSQGATQLYQHSKDANATPEKGMVMSLYFPSEMRQINKVLLRLQLKKFRSYSQTTEAGGAVAQTTEAGGGTGETSTSSATISGNATSGPSSITTSKNATFNGGDIMTDKTGLEFNTEKADAGSGGVVRDESGNLPRTGSTELVTGNANVSISGSTDSSTLNIQGHSTTGPVNASGELNYSTDSNVTGMSGSVAGNSFDIKGHSTQYSNKTTTDETSIDNWTNSTAKYLHPVGHIWVVNSNGGEGGNSFPGHYHSISLNVIRHNHGMYHYHDLNLSSVGYHDHGLSLTDSGHSHNFLHFHNFNLTGVGSHSHSFNLYGVGGHSHGVGSHNHAIGEHSHSGGNHFHRVYVSRENGHSHAIQAEKLAHTHNIEHTHEVEFSSIGAHSHTFSIGSHSHRMEIPAHTHKIQAGIFESGSPSSFSIYVNNALVTTVSASSFNDDITDWLLNDENQIPRNRWIDVEIRPNDLAYVVCSVFVQGFVQSRGGGNY